jgi:aminoglycoside phosphotransferase (APT) family kinase protein
VRTNRNLIEIDGAIVRRYPLTAADLADLENIAARHEAAREVGLPVPRVLAVKADHLVLERSVGTPLMETRLSPDAEERLSEHLCDLLAAMADVSTWPLPVRPWTQAWAQLRDAADTPHTRAALATAAQVSVALTHGDLSAGNLLVTSDGDLCAVIDWDGATLADPAQDFVALCANVEPGVARGVRARVAHAEVLQARADTYIATWPIQHELWLAGRHPWFDSPHPDD